MKVVKETQYLVFKLVVEKPKTNVYLVCNKSTDNDLGEIEWYYFWRQYVFAPTVAFSTVFNHTCLAEIAEFLNTLNTKHKEKKNQGL